MRNLDPSSVELLQPESLARYFSAKEVLLSRAFLPNSVTSGCLDQLDENNIMSLPTDGGDVYGCYTDSVPSILEEVAIKLTDLVAQAADQELDPTLPYHCELLKYQNGKSLTLHRDKDGHSVTKIILTVSGTANFLLESEEFPLKQGDLVILRGREFADSPTALHGTESNWDRRILLAQPNYKQIAALGKIAAF